jgi:hypothetical protein
MPGLRDEFLALAEVEQTGSFENVVRARRGPGAAGCGRIFLSIAVALAPLGRRI